ncbi:MAG: enoyl-CoA hydratase-related protein [Marinilabiliales bacterium]
MLQEIIDCFNEIKNNDEVRLVVIRGKGNAFSSGADLNWMRNVADYSFQENFEESLLVSKCFETIYKCPKPTVAVVHKAAIGGANGFIAPCDIAIATQDTVFSMSEVKIGIVPACISPYLLKRMGEFYTRELMLSGKRFSGLEALLYGLVNHVFSDLNACDEFLKNIIFQFKSSAPNAIGEIKSILASINDNKPKDFFRTIDFTANKIAELRSKPEGQEGMSAFLEKRKPEWNE